MPARRYTAANHRASPTPPLLRLVPSDAAFVAELAPPSASPAADSTGCVVFLAYRRVTSLVPVLLLLFCFGLLAGVSNVVFSPISLHVTPGELIGRVSSGICCQRLSDESHYLPAIEPCRVLRPNAPSLNWAAPSHYAKGALHPRRCKRPPRRWTGSAPLPCVTHIPAVQHAGLHGISRFTLRESVPGNRTARFLFNGRTAVVPRRRGRNTPHVPRRIGCTYYPDIESHTHPPDRLVPRSWECR